MGGIRWVQLLTHSTQLFLLPKYALDLHKQIVNERNNTNNVFIVDRIQWKRALERQIKMVIGRWEMVSLSGAADGNVLIRVIADVLIKLFVIFCVIGFAFDMRNAGCTLSADCCREAPACLRAFIFSLSLYRSPVATVHSVRGEKFCIFFQH